MAEGHSWARFKAASTAGGALAPLSVELRVEHYPYWASGRLGETRRLMLYARANANVNIVDPWRG